MILNLAGTAYSEVTMIMKNQNPVSSIYKQITTSLNKTISLSADNLIYARRNATKTFNPM